MITNANVAGGNTWYGLTKDVKPTKAVWIVNHSDPTKANYDPEGKKFPVQNGDCWYQIDTATAFVYDAENDKWCQVK